MKRGDIQKLIVFNIGVISFNVILFSPGFVGLRIDLDNAFKTALSITILIMSVSIFIYGNYSILKKKTKSIEVNKIDTEEECIDALKENSRSRVFYKSIKTLLNQIERMDTKQEKAKELLLEKFNEKEMSYIKYCKVLEEVRGLFIKNIKSVVNKINIFDEDDYEASKKDFRKAKMSKDITRQKLEIYKEYLVFIRDSIEDNEEIILKMDKLILELSKFNSLSEGEIENMSAMKEIDDLISKTKYYK